MSEHDHRPSEDAVPVEALGLDGFETGLLSILRHFLTAFARPDTQAWQTAFAISCERWDAVKGPQVALALLSVIHALRQARLAAFRYADPLCPTCRTMATGDEVAMMLMLQAMRRDDTHTARGAVRVLAEGVMDPVLIQSALAFAARWPAEAADGVVHPVADARPRHLRLVH
jgi:hypothetical protein